MERRHEDMSLPAPQKMQEYISSGRNAIVHALLSILIRPRALTSEDEAELGALYALLALFNSLMARYEDPKSTADELIQRVMNKGI